MEYAPDTVRARLFNAVGEALDGAVQWGCYPDVASLDKLIKYLNPRGKLTLSKAIDIQSLQNSVLARRKSFSRFCEQRRLLSSCCWHPAMPQDQHPPGGGGGVRVVLGTNLVQVFPLLVRALHKITKALRDLVHKFGISFAFFWLL